MQKLEQARWRYEINKLIDVCYRFPFRLLTHMSWTVHQPMVSTRRLILSRMITLSLITTPPPLPQECPQTCPVRRTVLVTCPPPGRGQEDQGWLILHPSQPDSSSLVTRILSVSMQGTWHMNRWRMQRGPGIITHSNTMDGMVLANKKFMELFLIL